MSKIDELVNEYDKVKTKFQEEAKKLFHEAFKEFFEKNPEIKSILWCQYTPHFNDGDACIFIVHDFNYSLTVDNIAHVESSDCWGDSTNFYGAYEESAPNYQAFDEFAAEIRALPDEIFLDLFEDHVMVLATRQGFDTEEYSHD